MPLFPLPFLPKPPVVPVVRLAGAISAAPSPLRTALNLPALAGTIDRACAVRGLQAVALQVNSPGGSPVQSALIAGRVRARAKERDVPIFAFIEDIAASGGYWLACAADEIYADRASIVGSIGVISAGFGFHEAIARLGVERRVHTQGRNKAMLDPFREEKTEDVARLEELHRGMHRAFIDHVRDRRGKRLKGDDDALFNGDVWTGERAVELGLIDGLGELRATMRDRFGENVRLPVMGARRGWLRQRLGMTAPPPPFDAAALAGGLAAAVEERALWARFGL